MPRKTPAKTPVHPKVLRLIFKEHLRALRNPGRVLDYAHTDHKVLARGLVEEHPYLFSHTQIDRAIEQGKKAKGGIGISSTAERNPKRCFTGALRRLRKGPSQKEIRENFLPPNWASEARMLARKHGFEEQRIEEALYEFHDGLRLRRLKGKLPHWMTAQFNIAAPYSALIPGNRIHKITKEDWKYHKEKIHGAEDKFLILYEGRPIGFVTGSSSRSKYKITSLFVERPFRRRYIAQWALGEVIGKKMKRGAVNIVINDMITNTEHLAKKIKKAHERGTKVIGMERVLPYVSKVSIADSNPVEFNGKTIMVNDKGRIVKKGGRPFRPRNLILEMNPQSGF